MQWTSFNFTYGTVEFRAKMPGGTGTWPAIWLLGANCQASYISSADNIGICQWPLPGSDEIDITEIINSKYTSVNQEIHTGGPVNGPPLHNDGCTPTTTDTSQNYHIYQFVWQKGSAVWKIDGKTTCTVNQTYVPSTAMFLIINTAVGGVASGPVNPSSLPKTMSVDYVRVTQNGTTIFDDEFGNAPNPPSNLTVTGVTPSSAALTWTPQTSQPTGDTVASYNVYRGSSPSGVFAVVGSALAALTSYTDATVVAGTSYYYVTSVDSSANESAPSNTVAAVIPAPPSPLAILTSSLPAGLVGAGYNASLSGSGGTTPYKWTATGLAAGLSLNAATGQITGTPTSATVYSEQITLTDSAKPTPASVTAVFSVPVTVPAGGPIIRVRAGTSTAYTDPSANLWAADAYYSGGAAAVVITHAITNTTTQPLYQTERYNGFTYTFTGLPSGLTYAVTLKFAENYWTAAGKRVFNVILNGTTVLSAFDIFKDAGGQYIADDKTFSTTVNASGQIVIQFQNGSADNAKVDAIQLLPSGVPLPTPQISPGSETFGGSIPVSINDTNSTAAIYYTTDNSAPSPGVGTTQVYSAPFNVTATTTVKAIATASGSVNSLVATATYTLQSETTPAITPGSETFVGSVPVSINDLDSTAAIYYTTDGSTPTPGVGTTQVYGAPFSVTATTTVKAIAVASGYANSLVATATYTLQSEATPTIAPGSETFASSVPVSINDLDSAAAIYYTTDGSAPTPGVGTTKAYGGSFNVTATTTVKAMATATGYANSLVASATYTLQSAVTGPSIRVRAGTSTSYTDPTGNVWSADSGYSGGTVAAVITHAITKTTTQPLYQTERYNGFTYTFTGLPVGSPYVVTLKFAEDYWTAAGKRVFNVILNGTTVLSAFDIFKDAGGQYIADDKTFSTTVSASGQIVIQFQNGSVDYAKVDAIQLVP